MKKRAILILFLLMFSFLNMVLTLADDVPGIPTQLQPDNIAKTQAELEGLRNQTSSGYLKQEWTKMFEGNSAGRVILAISGFIENLNPFFRIVLGVDYSLSWVFVFAVAIWLILFFILYPITKAITGNNSILAIIASFVIVSLIGVSGVIKGATNFLSDIIKNPWIAWLSLALSIFIVILIHQTGKLLQKESKEEELERDKQVLHKSAEVEEKNLKDE